MKVFLCLVLFAATVLAQNPYEYVDEDMFQKVGQIIYEYDQKVAASRSTGNGNSGSFSPSPVRKPEYNRPVPYTNNYNNNYRPQNNYRQQRQYNDMPVQPKYQQPAPYVAAAPRMYQKPEVVQPKQQFFGYDLSRPEPMMRVAEFHYTEDKYPQEQQGHMPQPAGPVEPVFRGNGRSNRFQMA